MALPSLCRLAGLWPLLLGPSVAEAQSPGVAAVDQYLREERERQGIPGMAVAILRGDSVILSRGYGLANLELQVAATDSTVFQSGSVGKQFTAAGILLLVEDGKLGLDDPIRRHLPEGPRAWDRITVRHLLTHTSGIPDYADSTLDYRRDYTEADLIRLAAGLREEFAPGERWSYSNTGYVLLGVIIRRVSGQFYGDLLRDRIFRPLGMTATRIISEADLVPNRADGYERVDGALRNQAWVSPTLNTTADGALYLTVRDLSRWAVALNHGTVPGRAGLDTAWTPLRLNDGGTYGYGFGWSLDWLRGQRMIGHGGSWQGFRAAIQRFPDFGLTVIVLANVDDARVEAVAMGAAGLIEPALTPPHRLDSGALAAGPEAADLLRRAAEGGSDALTPGLARFLTRPDRERIRRITGADTRWTDLGCDGLAPWGLTRLGAPVSRSCYAVADRAGRRQVFTLMLDPSGRLADFDSYGF